MPELLGLITIPAGKERRLCSSIDEIYRKNLTGVHGNNIIKCIHSSVKMRNMMSAWHICDRNACVLKIFLTGSIFAKSDQPTPDDDPFTKSSKAQ